MRSRRIARSTALAFLFVAVGHAAPSQAACRAESGPLRNALVELYTSEGCSSCPPADRRLRELVKAGPRVVPLALHVDYWDAIGWKDPFAQAAFSGRQAWEVQANGHRTSYTPHFFVNGREVEDWRADLDDALRPAVRPAIARIAVALEARGASALRIKVDGVVDGDARVHGPVQLFVAVTESGIVSQVAAGENRGVRLAHDAVARKWIGPIPLRDNAVSYDRVVELAQPTNGHVGAIAFFQDATTADVLQAVDTGLCTPTRESP